MADPPVGICLLFPDLLGTYGDGGNAVVLQKRLAWRGIETSIVPVASGEAVPASCDIYLLGGGEDSPQVEAARELGTDGPLHRAVDRGAVVFAVCAGMQIAGRAFPDASGRPIDGLGLLDCETVRTDEPRAVGELLVDCTGEPELGLPRLPPLTGFENHGGRTRLGPGAHPLGRVTAGVGNGDGTEGVLDVRRRGRAVGTYLHGPCLARNPALADLLLEWALGQELAPIADGQVGAEIDALRAERLLAVEKGNLDGVARRTWRDRVLRRS